MVIYVIIQYILVQKQYTPSQRKLHFPHPLYASGIFLHLYLPALHYLLNNKQAEHQQDRNHTPGHLAVLRTELVKGSQNISKRLNYQDDTIP